MKINYQQVLDRANIIWKNKVEEKYRKDFPNLDINMVEVDLPGDVESVLQALVEIINEQK